MTSLPPSRSRFTRKPVAVGVCSPLQWRNRPRFSRGSLLFDCECERERPQISKSVSFLRALAAHDKKEIYERRVSGHGSIVWLDLPSAGNRSKKRYCFI